MAQSRQQPGYELVSPPPISENGRKGIFHRNKRKVSNGPKPAPRRHVSETTRSRRRAQSTSFLDEQPNKPQRSVSQYYNIRTPDMAKGLSAVRDRGSEMMLAEFAAKYQNDLPQQVRVTKGVYCAEDEDFTISNSERLNIHFIRHRESVSTYSGEIRHDLVYMYIGSFQPVATVTQTLFVLCSFVY